jgi:uncharacterized lipoprotein YddW (UPF0748 family)
MHQQIMLLFAGSMFSAVVRSVVAALSALSVVWPVAPAEPARDEVRALWVVRTTLASPDAIATMVLSAKASGFNTLLVQIRGRGDAYYQNALEPRPPALAAQPSFDPLATTIQRAHDAGLKVHAWVNVNLVAGLDLPSAREHVVYRHPEWLMVPKELATDLSRVDPHSPEYAGRLARFARLRPNEIEGVYLSPVTHGAEAYSVSVVRDIVSRYGVDGVHLDYIRYPDENFDYGRETLAAFKHSLAPDLTAADERKYDDRATAEPAIYTRAFPERWRAFRVGRMTDLVVALRNAVKAARPEAVFSAAVTPDQTDAATHRLQDWRSWVDRDLLDVLCPMIYTTDASVFATQVAAAREVVGARHPLWAGIGAYRLSPDQIVENVQAARRIGAGGIILFSYDSLTEPPRGPDFLAQLGRAAFTHQ